MSEWIFRARPLTDRRSTVWEWKIGALMAKKFSGKFKTSRLSSGGLIRKTTLRVGENCVQFAVRHLSSLVAAAAAAAASATPCSATFRRLLASYLAPQFPYTSPSPIRLTCGSCSIRDRISPNPPRH